ncbi:MAG: dihydropteroate synthase [Deltaproteobacteria bacterium]|nr:dihydropteroate synthase [Deltaproteobacteria bacterium]
MTKQSFHHARGEFEVASRPILFGILNVTPDSFSDGGRFDSVERALSHATAMTAEGADVIDVGGESTRPGASEVAVDVEISRVVPIVRELARSGAIVSIDTRKAAVATAALDAGAAIINDVSGLAFDPAMARLVAERNAGVIIMHTRGTSATMRDKTHYKAVIDDVLAELRVAVEHAIATGIRRRAIAVDPGIGFAKTASQSLEIIGALERFLALGLPILVGPSRKSFIEHITGKPADQRAFGTAAAVAIAVAKGASMIRVHDVAAMREVALVAHAIATATHDPASGAP